MQLHPLCAVFPRISGIELDQLKKDIKDNGLMAPIILHEGMILDGGNRYQACLDVGVAPRFEPFNGKDALAFVISANLHRRHLTESQRSMIASDIAKLESGSNQHTKEGGGIQPPSQTEAAVMLKVSRDSVKKARKVAKAAPEVIVEAVRDGSLSLNAAEKLMKLPEEVQKEIAELPKDEVVKAVKRATAKSKEDFEAQEAEDEKTEVTSLREFVAEQGRVIEDLLAESNALHSDDPMQAFSEENKKLREQVRVLSERINSLTNEKAAAINQANKWKRMYERLEREAKRAA